MKRSLTISLILGCTLASLSYFSITQKVDGFSILACKDCKIKEANVNSLLACKDCKPKGLSYTQTT